MPQKQMKKMFPYNFQFYVVFGDMNIHGVQTKTVSYSAYFLIIFFRKLKCSMKAKMTTFLNFLLSSIFGYSRASKNVAKIFQDGSGSDL